MNDVAHTTIPGATVKSPGKSLTTPEALHIVRLLILAAEGLSGSKTHFFVPLNTPPDGKQNA